MIGKLRNLGPHSQKMLAAAGIKTESQLRAKRAAAAFVAVKRAGCTPSLNLLWAIEGTLTERDWKDVAKNDRLSLLTQVEMLEKGKSMSKANEYLQQLTALMKQLTARGFTGVKLECKHFFSGAAVYADGRICMSLTAVGFAIKLPGESRNALMNEQGAKPLRYFPKGPIKKEYVVLPKSMLKNMKALRRWAKASIEHALSLPAPVRKGK
jgi:DNA transformation protein